jgi:hypothetical protein
MRLTYFLNPNSKYSKQDFIDSLIDFAANTHGSKLGSRPGDQIKQLIPSLSSGKPRSVSYNNWFLFNYGYKYCSSCSLVIHAHNFSSNTSTWNKLSSICKSCDNYRCSVFKNNNKEQTTLTYTKWYEDNKEVRSAATAKRRADKLQATPKWLTNTQRIEILNKYKECKQLEKETGIKYHVDHIVPLCGISVCGLHVPWNLQVLTAKENMTKSNKT